MKGCIFCKLVAGEIPSAKIYEDKRFVAVMDAFPAVNGQFLVIPKEHITSKFTEVPDHVLADVMLTAKKVAMHVDFRLGTRACVSIEGFQVPHLHVNVYPLPKGKFMKDCYVGGPPAQAG
jgi:histidine triad (HIT) family protein